MRANSYKHIINLASSLIVAFFTIGAISLLFLPEARNYYDLRLIDLDELKYLMPGFVAFAAGVFFLQLKADRRIVLLSTTLSYMLFLLVFSVKAPVFSLAIGALVFGGVGVFVALAILFGKKEAPGSKQTKAFLISIAGAVIIIFGLLTVFAFIKANQEYQPYYGYNGSKISDNPLFSDDIKKVFLIGLYIFLGGLVLYLALAFIKIKNIRIQKTLKIASWIIPGTLLLLQVVVFSVFMVYRVKSMIASTYDFGIFTQMFYSMKNFEGMMTTLERSVAISHLDVHFSPIYYLMLPAFMIFPKPETLQVLQVLIAASGVIPLSLIMKELKTGKLMRMLLLIMFIASPAIISSSMYDLHENCFLPPLLLFVIYFGIRRKTLWLLLFVALSLMVKEDSGLYIVFIGLYFAVSDLTKDKPTKEKIINAVHGLGMAAISVAYFIIVTNHIDTSGAGAMFWRYDNINGYTDLGMIGILLSVFQDPSYFFATFFTPAKIKLLLITLACTGFLPLFQRNMTVFLLAVPVIIMNYASNYLYQHELGFQYFYGTGTLLIFMAVLAEKAGRENPLQWSLFKKIKPTAILGILGAAIALAFGTKYIVGSGYAYKIYQEDPGRYQSMKATLNLIPKDKKVVATGYLTAHLADREILYDYNYYNILTSTEVFDYVIIDTREGNQSGIKNRCEAAGYVESPLSSDYIMVYVPIDND
ncbi:MAG: DUF2079 domain-containing protein [Candidatus Izemoplasmatales bacterium]|nr:DUF2079 domain-containing protein [Candidatus Izemoplasmatales bacterium]